MIYDYTSQTDLNRASASDCQTETHITDFYKSESKHSGNQTGIEWPLTCPPVRKSRNCETLNETRICREGHESLIYYAVGQHVTSNSSGIHAV
jgi:hypothetical protein